MSKRKYRDEIEYLLRQSHWNGKGPHGKTINAVMKRVDKICSIVTIRPVTIRRAG